MEERKGTYSTREPMYIEDMEDEYGKKEAKKMAEEMWSPVYYRNVDGTIVEGAPWSNNLVNNLVSGTAFRSYAEQIEDYLLHEVGLTGGEAKLMHTLLGLNLHFENVYPTAACVASTWGYSTKTFWRAIDKLKDLGLVKVIHRYILREEAQIANLYVLRVLWMRIANFLRKLGLFPKIEGVAVTGLEFGENNLPAVRSTKYRKSYVAYSDLVARGWRYFVGSRRGSATGKSSEELEVGLKSNHRCFAEKYFPEAAWGILCECFPRFVKSLAQDTGNGEFCYRGGGQVEPPRWIGMAMAA